MAKYRRKPEEVEAEQWFPWKKVEGVTIDERGRPTVNTLVGDIHINYGDWIVRSGIGWFYIYGSQEFDLTFDPVEE